MGRDVERFRQVERRLWAHHGIDPVEHFVRLRTGETVRVLETGEGPPVLFVHGVMVGASSWILLLAALSGFRCLALDRPGCGLSEPAANAPLTDVSQVASFADDLAADVLDALDVERASIAATSYGGYFGIRGAAAHPDRFDRMVLYSWPMGAPMEKVPFSMRMAGLPGVSSLMGRMPVNERVVAMLLRQVGLERAIDTGSFDDLMIEWTTILMRETPTMRNELASAPRVVTPIGGLNDEMLHSDDLMRRVKLPVLFLWGEEDPNGGRAVAQAFAQRFSDSTLELLPEAGHAPWLDRFDTCVERTREFLAG